MGNIIFGINFVSIKKRINMKLFMYLLGLSVLFSACKSSKEIQLEDTSEKKMTLEEKKEDNFLITKKIEIFPNKKIELKKDGTGKIYTVFSKGDKVVFIIKKSQSIDPPMPDGHLEYTLTFETGNPLKKSTWEDEELQEIHAVFGFHAFHPESGYYPLKKGKITLIPDAKKKVIKIEVDVKHKYADEINGTYEIPLEEKQ